MTINRYWVSWWQPTEDHRPLTDPPHPQVLGWWCSGSSDEGDSICALVEAESEDKAKVYVQISWPEAENWRFIEAKPNDWIPGDRFPPQKWMLERWAH